MKRYYRPPKSRKLRIEPEMLLAGSFTLEEESNKTIYDLDDIEEKNDVTFD